MSKKSNPSKLQLGTAAWKHSTVDDRIIELRALERAKLDQILALEADGGNGSSVQSDNQREIAARARRLVNGHASRADADREGSLSLDEVRMDRAAITIALHELQGIQTLQRDRQQAVLAAELGDEWRATLRETAIALCALRALNKLRTEFRRVLPSTKLPCDRYRLLGAGAFPTEADAFLDDVLKAGIVTPSEIKNWSEIPK